MPALVGENRASTWSSHLCKIISWPAPLIKTNYKMSIPFTIFILFLYYLKH